MKAVAWCRANGIDLTRSQVRACNYLESWGHRFLVDFGYQNAVANAKSDWQKRKRKRR
jgi:hypothetical protein